MARYGEAFRSRVVARLLPPESAEIGVVSREVGVSVQTLERWRDAAQTMPARGRAENRFLATPFGLPKMPSEFCRAD